VAYHQTLNQAPKAAKPSDDLSTPQPPAGSPAAARAPPYPFPHITTEELAARWRVSRFSISSRYLSWGLRPIRIGRRLLWPIDQIEACERRFMGQSKPGRPEPAQPGGEAA